MSTKNEALTWDDLADLYRIRTGGVARIRPMEEVFDWALTQPDISKTEDGSLILGPREENNELLPRA